MLLLPLHCRYYRERGRRASLGRRVGEAPSSSPQHQKFLLPLSSSIYQNIHTPGPPSGAVGLTGAAACCSPPRLHTVPIPPTNQWDLSSVPLEGSAVGGGACFRGCTDSSCNQQEEVQQEPGQEECLKIPLDLGQPLVTRDPFCLWSDDKRVATLKIPLGRNKRMYFEGHGRNPRRRDLGV